MPEAEGRGVRDPLLHESLKRLAAEAATRLTTLVANGAQIPFDVAEQEGDESIFHSYVPLTARFVRDQEDELRALPGFEPAREAVELAGAAAPYLERRGEPVPASARERSTRMLTAFLASLWDGCAEFALDRARLDKALAVIDAELGDADEGEVLIAPVAGLQMAPPRLNLPHGLQLVRADAIEAPVEAMRSEGMGRAAWQPQFLAVAQQGEGGESASAALRQLHDLISVMRLFKGGGVALGPHAFAPGGEGGWRRIATGAEPPRAGGYSLSEEEAERLASLAAALEARPDPAGALAWAARRFELGCGRPTPLEGLSDHLLALRAVLDGQGPVGASLPMRAAALIAGTSPGRHAARERLEAAMELERSLMAGARAGDEARQLAAWVEEGVRRIIREAALGELGADLGEAADEALIATGLDAGDAEIAVSGDEEVAVSGDEEISVASAPEPEPTPVSDFHHRRVGPESAAREETRANDQEGDMEETRIMEPIPAEGEIKITATHWLDEVEETEGREHTLDFPAAAGDSIRARRAEPGADQRERVDSPRVRHLFPVPEDADWDVRELDYDHYRRRA